MNIVGREAEQAELKRLFDSKEPEFVVVYGRRRVGKTFLVREHFGGKIVFSLTGLGGGERDEPASLSDQLENFDDAMRRCFGKAAPLTATPSVATSPAAMPLTATPPATSWFEAMNMLRDALERLPRLRRGKRVVFIDEMPWLDTPKSKFVSALEHFWNGWASSRPDIMLIVCGSATAWITKKLLRNRRGLHNRVTSRIFLSPFSLRECERYLAARGFRYKRKQIVDLYMALGGIPFYLRQLQKGASVAQNIDRLCFGDFAPLANEFDEMYRSLFRSPEKHISIVRALSQGGSLTNALSELEQSGFIAKHREFTKDSKGHYYMVVDLFTLFYLRFMDSGRNKSGYWTARTGAPARSAWSGFSYELVCLLHVDQIKRGLGVSGVATDEAAWRSKHTEPGAQIDLVIKRRDRTINLCEVKYSDSEYRLGKREAASILNRREAFEHETRTRYDVQVTMITTFGVKPGAYDDIFQSELTLEDLFG